MSYVDDPSAPIAAAIEDAAADWLVRRHAGLAAGEEAQLLAWLAADWRHAAAFDRLEKTWDTLTRPRRTGEAAAARRELRARAQRRSRRRAWRLGTASFAFAAALTLMFLRPPSLPWSQPEISSTAVVRPHVRTLPDGTIVELDSGAEIVVEFSAAKRGVRLVRGAALFSVVKDAARPFVVAAAGVEVRAVGTAFSVRLGAQRIDVLVTEGRVAVERNDVLENTASLSEAGPSPDRAVHFVGAGELAIVPLAPGIEQPSSRVLAPAEIASALAWRDKRLELTGTPLAAVVELLNRQNRLQLAIADPATGRVQVTGIVWIDDPEGFVRLLENGLNVESKRAGATIVLRQASDGPNQ